MSLTPYRVTDQEYGSPDGSENARTLPPSRARRPAPWRTRTVACPEETKTNPQDLLLARIIACPGRMGGQRRSKSNLLDTENRERLRMCSIASFATVKVRGSAPNRSVQTALHHAKAQRPCSITRSTTVSAPLSCWWVVDGFPKSVQANSHSRVRDQLEAKRLESRRCVLTEAEEPSYAARSRRAAQAQRRPLARDGAKRPTPRPQRALTWSAAPGARKGGTSDEKWRWEGGTAPRATSRRREAPEERGVVPRRAVARGRSADAGATWC